jgi:hypothetical protein
VRRRHRQIWVGLKDALATFDRQHIGVAFHSRHGQIEIGKVPKHGFEDIRTIHALISPASDPAYLGTDIPLTGVTDEDMASAKGFFLRSAGDEVLDTTTFGHVLDKGRAPRVAPERCCPCQIAAFEAKPRPPVECCCVCTRRLARSFARVKRMAPRARPTWQRHRE